MRLIALLIQKNWTQKRLSDETGITQATISRFDRTSRHEIDHIFTIAYVLGIPVEKLFETRIIKDGEEER
ncbi:helix-turn-helix domain-containing protein [Lihuaxuella thermophila]|uniref:helix-turn-helix domain-containing protein n=1 Tax=Lihuaxuella thermophila TaxID=1173111 RepID=UPI00244E7F0A|nr:helix-turn-helix transcriptional regulator [Lihuaxuella thermophila]